MFFWLKRFGSADSSLSGTTGGQDVSVLILTKIFLIVFGLLNRALLAHMLLPEGWGSYAVCLAFGGLLSLVSSPGAIQGSQYFVLIKKMNVAQGVSCALAICVAGGGLVGALTLPLIYGDAAFFQKAPLQAFQMMLLMVPIVAFSSAIEHQLAALRRFSRIAVFSVLRSFVGVLAIAFFVWYLELGVNGAIFAFAIGHCVMIGLCVGDLRRHFGKIWELPVPSNIKRIFGYGVKFHFARIGIGIGFRAGVLILGFLAVPNEIGIFDAAIMLMLGFMPISDAVGNALLPRIAGRGRPELVALSFRLVCAVTGAFILVFLAFSTPLVRILLSEPFLPAVSFLWIIAPGVLAHAGSGILMTYFKGVDRPGVCSWAVSLGLMVDLSGLLLLYSHFGVVAAAWTMTLGMICRVLLLAIIFKRSTGLSWVKIGLPRFGDAAFLWKSGRSVVGRDPGRSAGG